MRYRLELPVAWVCTVRRVWWWAADRRRSELAKLDQEIGRLTPAISTASSSLPTVLEALQTRQRRRDDLAALAEELVTTHQQRDVVAFETEARGKLEEWRAY